MTDRTDPASRTIDAYKSIIDFNKTLIAISSSVLTALTAFVVYNNITLKPCNFIDMGMIIGSILLSLLGFGNAIKTIKDEVSRDSTILFTNLSASLLIIGIVFLFTFKQHKAQNIDNILKKVEKSTTSLKGELTPANLCCLRVNKDVYTIVYSVNGIDRTVKFSIMDDKIISVK